MPRLCEVIGCRFRTIGSHKDGPKEHQANYHSLVRTVQYLGASVQITRDGPSGTLSCPCGNPHHARYSFQKIYSLCRRKPHPEDNAAFPDNQPSPVDDVLLSELLIDKESVAEQCSTSIATVLDTPPEDSHSHVTATPHDLVEQPAAYAGNVSPFDNGPPLLLPHSLSQAAEKSVDGDFADLHQDLFKDDAMDVDSEPEDALQDFDIDLTKCPSFAGSPSVPDSVVAKQLFSLGLQVDNRFHLTICLACQLPINYTTAHSHLLRNHKIPRFRYPPKQELDRLLLALNANDVRNVLPGPITPIPGIAIVQALKCTTHTCPQAGIFPDKRRFNEHCKLYHHDVPKKEHTWLLVKAHILGKFRAFRQMVEVVATPPPSDSSLLDDVVQHSKSIHLHSLPDIFTPSSNARTKGSIFAHIGWDHLLRGVNIRDLRMTVEPPDTTEGDHRTLVKSVERYYALIAPQITTLSVLTARYIASPAELASQPFKRLQEDATLLRYSQLTAYFLIFLIRHLDAPVPGFLIPLHPQHVESLTLLKQSLSVGNDNAIQECIHAAILDLLTHTSLDARTDEHKDPLTLFLAVYHLRDNVGNTTRISAIPPNLSAFQWCFRATAVREVLEKAPLYEGDTYIAYEKHAKHLITDGRQSLFTFLRQKHALLSSIAYTEPGLPQFNWDSSLKILSVDGFPLSLDRLTKSVAAVQTEMERLIEALCLGIDFSDVFTYIDSRMDPKNPEMWFVDRPREELQGTSVMSQDKLGLATFSQRLLNAVAQEGRFFSKIDGSIVPQKLAIWRWITKLDELVSASYYAITLTWGGGARGTECDSIKHTIHGLGDRHIFILNGLLGIATTYVKTQHIQGHGRLIVRTPCASISRLVLFSLSVLYPVAAHLSSFVMEVEHARAYLSYVFVHHGTILDSHKFSSILQYYTEKYLGISLGLRDYRQVMCSMLCCIAKTDYGAPDEADQDLAAIHAQFGHSVAIADAHYGIQGSNALASVSHTAVRSMQRVSARWHACLGYGKRDSGEDSQLDIRPDSTSRMLEALKAPLTETLQQTTRAYIQDFYESTMPHWTSILQGVGSNLTTFINAGLQASSPLPPSQLSPLVIHPRLRERLQVLYPGQTFAFNCSQQAELVQSCFTNDHVLAVLPTGSGKSLAFFGAAVLNPDGLFIVITPFVALMEDMVRRLAASPITGGRWSPQINPARDQIVIVPAHEAGSEFFFKWAEASNKRLRRVFVDEAHHIFTSDSYRPCFRLFHRLTQLKKPITFLSATLPVRSIPALCSSMMIHPALLRIIRAPTSRPNIRYRVVKVLSDDVVQETAKVFQSISLLPSERGIIYTTSIAFTHEISKTLGIPSYTSRILEDNEENKAEKTRIFQQWRSGEVQWVAATICFAEGVDFQSVRYVIIVEPRDMLSFLQESGRLGRDGLPSTAITLWSWIQKSLPDGDPDHSGKAAMVHFLESNTCRRLAFVDFDPDVHSCASLALNELCDACLNLSRSDKWYVAQPLRFDLPPVCNPTTPLNATPPSMTVKSNGQAIEDAYQVGHEKLERLRKVLAHITAIKCADCWVLGEVTAGEHTHARHYRFASLLSSLQSKQRKDNTFWPACYLCWVPFRAPCSHPQLRRGIKVEPDKCPNSNIPFLIPTLVTLLYLHDDKLNILASVSHALGLNPPLSRQDPLDQFIDWISETPQAPDTVPHYALFLITFAECFNRL